MSAYMVSKAHIDRLVALALHGPRDRGPRYPGDAWNGPRWWSHDLATLHASRNGEREDIVELLTLRGETHEAIRAEIDGTYAAFWQHHRREITRENADAVGALLIATNLHSIHERYPATVDHPDRTPGPIAQYWDAAYRFPASTERVMALEGLTAISCYEYQSCEFDGWHSSEAHSFCDALRDALCSVLTRDTKRGWDNWDRAEATS